MTEALRRLAAWPRAKLVQEPTPLLRAPRLAAELNRAEPVLLKMDAETGLAMGGNKARKLEYELAPTRTGGMTHVITCGGVHSNHCRLTAAAAARLGLQCVLVLNGEPSENPTGNELLQRLLGADVRYVSDRKDRDPGMEAAAHEVEARGGHPLIVPLGASTPLGTLGYARAASELNGQLSATDHPLWIFVSASSCGTYAGLALGFTLLGRSDVRLIGVSSDTPLDEIRETTSRLVRGGAELLGVELEVPAEMLIAEDAYIGAGYGEPTDLSDEATRLFATLEGVLLESTYTAKVAAAMIDYVRTGRIGDEERVLFWHTGGYPSVFR